MIDGFLCLLWSVVSDLTLPAVLLLGLLVGVHRERDDGGTGSGGSGTASTKVAKVEVVGVVASGESPPEDDDDEEDHENNESPVGLGLVPVGLGGSTLPTLRAHAFNAVHCESTVLEAR